MHYPQFNTTTASAHTHTGLCTAVQPDGRAQRCIRFEGHEGPHQTFVAEWCTGEAFSRRRQTKVQFMPCAGKREQAVPMVFGRKRQRFVA